MGHLKPTPQYEEIQGESVGVRRYDHRFRLIVRTAVDWHEDEEDFLLPIEPSRLAPIGGNYTKLSLAVSVIEQQGKLQLLKKLLGIDSRLP